MKKSLQKELFTLDMAEFRELELCVSISRQVRNVQSGFNISVAQMCSQLQISLHDLTRYRTASYPFTVEDIAKIQALIAGYEIEKIKKDIDLLKVKE